MAELKPVKVHWEAMDRYAVFVVTRFEVMYEDQLIGYYRIFMEPNSVNIAFYSDTDFGNSWPYDIVSQAKIDWSNC